ncbi:hypothetical protein ACFQ9V_08580 [Leifsonia sp. NPDC056665]|uniref:hypothetical protein n=1 Tax=Leifsonia sp. NPDC056665 TaxID=3345901 RepID=UPI0036A34602
MWLQNVSRRLLSDHIVKYTSSGVLEFDVRYFEPASRLTSVTGLDGPQLLQPITILNYIAQSTPLQLLDDPYHLFRRWAVLKYLGAFDSAYQIPNSPPVLDLARQTSLVRANQRRVFSEELGIGFSIDAGVRWISQLRPNSLTRTVDVDNLIDTVPGIAAEISYDSRRRPDYLQMTSSPTDPTLIYLTALESKGSRAYRVSCDQLGNAWWQLDSMKVAGTAIPGLATGAVLDRGSVSINVLQMPTFENLGKGPAVRLAAGSLGHEDNAVERLAVAGIQASLATQSAVTGNRAGYMRWGRSRAEPANLQPPIRVPTDSGDIVGVQTTVPLFGGLVDVTIGVPNELNEMLAEAPLEALLRGQAEVIPRRRDRAEAERVAGEESSSELVSVGPDGTTLVLQFRSAY